MNNETIEIVNNSMSYNLFFKIAFYSALLFIPILILEVIAHYKKFKIPKWIQHIPTITFVFFFSYHLAYDQYNTYFWAYYQNFSTGDLISLALSLIIIVYIAYHFYINNDDAEVEPKKRRVNAPKILAYLTLFFAIIVFLLMKLN